MRKQGSFSSEDYNKVAKKIENYVFRNFTICGKSANSTEVYFAEIAKKIFEEEFTSSDVICNEIKKGMISDEEFKESFKRWTATKSSKETIRYILRKIHKYLDDTNELNIDNTEVHIEHIMPEEYSKWSIDEELHDNYLWRLGNLCLLSGPINQTISNEAFDIKRPYYKKSKIEPNKTIADYSKWDEESIEDRQHKFADYAVEIWDL